MCTTATFVIPEAHNKAESTDGGSARHITWGEGKPLLLLRDRDDDVRSLELLDATSALPLAAATCASSSAVLRIALAAFVWTNAAMAIHSPRIAATTHASHAATARAREQSPERSSTAGRKQKRHVVYYDENINEHHNLKPDVRASLIIWSRVVLLTCCYGQRYHRGQADR